MADFRQFYGIDLPLEAGDEDCRRWAMLWHALPRESRTARRQSPALEWGEGEYMLNRPEGAARPPAAEDPGR